MAFPVGIQAFAFLVLAVPPNYLCDLEKVILFQSQLRWQEVKDWTQ
jgi:hypothetical protein